MSYNAKKYWEERLNDKFNLRGTGHIAFTEKYNQWLYKAKIRTLNKAIKHFNIDITGKTICDIGCGTGFFVNFYKLQGAKNIVGIDLTNIGIENIKLRYPEYQFFKEDISSVTLVSNIDYKFDILNVFDTLYHITDDIKFEQAIINICKLTNDDGFILITDLFGSKNIDIASHVRYRSWKIYKTALEHNGREILAIYPLYYFLNKPILGKFKFTYFGKTLDSLFAPVYYQLDKIFLSPKRSNLNLIIAKKRKI